MSNSEETRERWMVLAELAAKEQDSNKLLALVTEINDLLGEKQPPSNFALRLQALPDNGKQTRAFVEEKGQE